jgi:hypothetical protein
MSDIFISYRRNDAGEHAGRLYDRLLQRFDSEDIFYDQSGIESGEHFPFAIQRALDSAQVILIIVGPNWLNAENCQRLNDEKDFVRREVLGALSRKEHETETAPHIMTVLVGGAMPPAELALPEPMQPLAFLQTHNIQGNFDDYNRQVEALCDLIGSHSRTWVSKQNLWLSSCLADKTTSFVNFNQDLSVLNPDSHYIQRKPADEAMDGWWSKWQENRKPFVLLGEEGDGKSWALASWLGSRLCLPGSQIPVVLISATKIGSDDLIAEMARILEGSSSTVAQPDWCKRLRLILKDTSATWPKIVMVLDGLNERPSFDWLGIFDKIRIAPLSDSVAVLVSCRTGYWREHLGKGYESAVCSWQLPTFNDQELDEALARHHLTRSVFSDRVLQLVAKPRYFDMAVRLKDRLAEAGDDVTVDRLIYEDWKDKTERKREPSSRISHDDFHAIITDIVSKYCGRIGISDLARELSSYGDQASIRSELVSSGILLAVGGGKFEVAPRPLVLGLGLLLAGEIEESGKTERSEIEEIIAGRLGSISDSDRLVQIIAMALFHSLLTEGYPDVGRIALFRAWIAGRNLDEADFERIYVNFPLRPSIYFQVAEELWSGRGNNREVQDHFMAAFLQKCHFERVREEMVAAFERWLGFVHPLGYRGFFERDDSKKEGLAQEVEKRLGQKIELGPLNLYGHRVEIVADQRLLSLAQVAESVISHYDRELFLQALCNGAVATAVMDGSLVDYRWIVRTALGTLHQALLEKARVLIVNGEETALRAAYRLLSWVCDENSLKLRDDRISEDFGFNNVWHKELLKEDRSNSTWILWDEDVYLDCVQRTQLAPIAITKNLREVALNPLCLLPEEYSAKIDAALQQIDLTQIRSYRGQTREDIAIRDIEPAMCAYRPVRYAELFRNLTMQLDGRDYLSCSLLSSKLYEHLPILTEVERDLVLKAWRLSLVAEGDEAGSTELTLFPMVIFDRSCREQFSLLRERGNKTGYLSRREAQYREIEAPHIKSLAEALDSYDSSCPEECYALLSYVAKALNSLDEELRERILKLFRGDNSIIRYLCLELIGNSNDQLCFARKVIENGWRANAENCDYENAWGSVLLARFAKEISFAALADRISLQWLGYAIKERGNRSDEIADYALRLHTIWTRIAKPTDSVETILRHVKISMNSSNNCLDEDVSVDIYATASHKFANYTWGGTAGMPTDFDFKRSFDPKVADEEWEKIHKQVMEVYAAEKKRGNHWIDTSFSNGNLDAVVASGSPYWREWIKPVLTGDLEGKRLLAFCQGLYESLCATLLNYEPETGSALFRAIMKDKTIRIIDSSTDIQHLLFSLFEAEESFPVRALWEEHLNDCDSDKALSEIAYLAQSRGKSVWLDGAIQAWISSELDYDKARALRLLGLSIEEKHGEQLRAWIDQHGRSWLMDVAKSARKCSERNSWARTWIERFIAEDDRVQSWAAFRLFLRCADKRFWIWGKDLINFAALPDWKKDAYEANIGTIMDAIKENEKKMKDTFIGHEVKENQLWPWMKKYAD